jgi:hypothetical protein
MTWCPAENMPDQAKEALPGMAEAERTGRLPRG